MRPGSAPIIVEVHALSKSFAAIRAVREIDFVVPTGAIFALVGPTGAGKTLTLSMMSGLLRPDYGTVIVHGADVWAHPEVAKPTMGVLPDRLRLFDRLTGAQLLYFSATLRGISGPTAASRAEDLIRSFDLGDVADRLVVDFSESRAKMLALACAMIHSPRVLILDEPFESIDSVSAAKVTGILQRYAAAGGTVVFSSRNAELVEQISTSVALIANGAVLASGSLDAVRGAGSLEERFIEFAAGHSSPKGMEWLHNFSD